MKLKINNRVSLQGPDGEISVTRNHGGIPEVVASTPKDLAYCNGWVHANDRQLHMMLTRIIMMGKASEYLAADEALIELDKFIRRMRFAPDIYSEIAKLDADARSELESYCDGINYFLETNSTIYEFKMLGYKPEPWTVADTLRQVKAFTYLGLSYAQGDMEKLIIQMIQKGIKEEQLRELYPYLKDQINVDLIRKVKLQNPLVPEAVKWLELIPRFSASNNWAISGERTESGSPIVCGDPHLEVNRLPGVWHEIILRLPENDFMGAGIPGAPGVLIGRNRNVAWSATYSFMDMVDYRIEQCKEGKYRRGDKWYDFEVHEEIITTKKGARIIEKIYENENGVLEGDPYEEGYYLVCNWSTRYGVGANDLEGCRGVMHSQNAREAMENFRKYDCSTYNWVMGDTDGAIAYQMSGRLFNRPHGVSGLVPHAGWDEQYNIDGYVPMDSLPSDYNPSAGIIVTANQDLNHLGEADPINLPMASYRADRIAHLLEENESASVEYMKSMHYDLYSLQAEKFMKLFQPHLPENDKGKILKEWDCTYTPESEGAVLFENIYISLLKIVFGDNGMGRDTVEYLMKETGVFNDYYENFDSVLLKDSSVWFGDDGRDELIQKAVAEGLALPVRPYGTTRKLIYSHLLFGGKLPKFLGFDRGPISLPGGRATIPQGQIFTSGGRTTSFSPSYRFITDLAGKEYHCNGAGGISDRRFSKLYFNRNDDWLKGVYSILTLS